MGYIVLCVLVRANESRGAWSVREQAGGACAVRRRRRRRKTTLRGVGEPKLFRGKGGGWCRVVRARGKARTTGARTVCVVCMSVCI